MHTSGARRSLVKDDAQQRAVDLESAVIFNQAELAELVHEEVDARARGPHHLGQRLLGELRQNARRRLFLPVSREQKQGTSEVFLAGIEELVDQVLLDPNIA